MKSAAFTYHAPQDLVAALGCLARYAPEDARVLAGGQSLVPSMAYRLVRPGHLIDINRVAGLDRLLADEAAARLTIGARVRHAAFEQPVVAGPLGPLMAQMAGCIAHYPIRRRGTFCGSLANADPASEWCLLAVALGAVLRLCSVRGERLLGAAEFFQGVMSTALAPDELLVEAQLPLPVAGTRFGFEEFSRRPGDFALAMVLVSYRIEKGRIEAPCVSVGAVEAFARRVPEAEFVLQGVSPGAAAFQAAAQAAAQAVAPLDLPQASAGYRRGLVETLTRRALEKTC
jgi:carbon-monoxide dehydrogenase medium subunit